MSDLRFLKVHINYLTAASISEILLEPGALAPPFSFFADLESYVDYYRRAFLLSYRLRKGGEVGEQLRYPFVRGLGELLPLAGHEVKNSPLCKAMGGNISYVLRSLKSEGGMLPMKLFPNWKIRLDPNVHGRYETLTKFSCSPLVRIYPHGIVSYQIKVSLASEQGIDLEKFITLMRSIMDKPLLETHRGKFNASSLAKQFHETILNDFLVQAYRSEDLAFSPLHRIVTISSVDGKLSPDPNRKELAAVVGLEPRWGRLSKSYVESHLGKSFEGSFEDQFFFFHPSCTIIYPSSPAVKPEFDSYVKRCLRSNFTSIVEAASLQSQLASALRQPLQDILDEAPYSLERKAELQLLLDRIKVAEWLLNGSWATMLRGAHRDFFHIVEEMIGLEGRSKRSLNILEELKHKLEEVTPTLSISEQIELNRMVENLDEISRVCRAFVDENPMRLSEQVGIARALMITAEDARNKLKAAVDQYMDLQQQPFASQQDIFKSKTYIYQLVLTNYRTVILPRFQDFTQQILSKEDEIKKIADEKRAKGISVPSPVETDRALNEAKTELASATKEDVTAGQTFPDIARFASKAKPYVEKLIKAARIALTVIGLFV